MPMGWPPYYPNDLIPLVTVIIGEALKKFPVQTQTLQLCKFVISRLTPHLCAAVQRKTLRADSALSVMGDLLHYLLVANCDDDNQRFRLHRETIKSDEWLKLAGEIVSVPIAGQPQGQSRETTEHKDAKPATEPPEEESEKHRPKEFEGLPKKPETETERMIDAARLTDKQRTCALLRWVYNLPVAEVARRIRKDRGTAYKHLSMAKRKMETHKDKIRKGLGINTPPEGPPR